MPYGDSVMISDDEWEEFFIIDKKTDKIRKLDPMDSSDAEIIQEHKDAIRHGLGIHCDVDKKIKDN